MEDKMGVKCSLCERTFRTTQARRGHLNFYHGLGKDTPFTEAIRWKINKHKDGVKKLEEEKVEDRTKREERREKAIGVLREYKKSLAESEDIGFIDEEDMRTEDDKFIEKVDFE